MVSHLTIRMAWHDNNWDGNICQEPEKNYYCTGTHSLLSDRLKKNKNIEVESNKENKGKKLDSINGYLPPCYWTSNAFSRQSLKISHVHPMINYASITSPINEVLKPFSVYSWPFKLSFNHSKEKKSREGKYPANLSKKIQNFIDKFIPNQSIIFFYLNYDNPILDEGEQDKYVLMGCALLSDKWDKNLPKEFDFPQGKLSDIRKPRWDKRNNRMNIDMINFPTMAWNIQFTYDFEKNGVLLPYKKYLDYRKLNEEDGDLKLKEMRILIDEDSLISSFKYVAMDIDDDKCIYLLNKIRRSIHKIQDHNLPGVGSFSEEKKTIDNLLSMVWKRRRIYPSLSKIIDILINKDVPKIDHVFKGEEIVEKLNNFEKPGDLMDKFLWFISTQELSKELLDYRIYLLELKKQLRFYDIDLIKKLSLFNLTSKQIIRILDDSSTFLSPILSKAQIVQNPYILCEDYIPEINESDLDEEDVNDEPIDFFKIDLGMFPQRYISERSDLQNLSLRSPERLRALVREFLKRIGEYGDCYGHLDDIYTFILEFPLYMGDTNLSFDKSYLYQTSPQCYSHFIEKLNIVENENGVFFYLKEVFEAEKFVYRFIKGLFNREDYNWDISNYEDFVNSEKTKIATDFKGFNEALFTKERLKLFNNIFKKSIFVISGKAGSGKTHVLGKIVEELLNKKEKVLLLAPTGKASLRLRRASGGYEAYTIDRFIYLNREGEYWDFLDHLENILIKKDKPKVLIENLIIDESSMIDLQKLVTLLFMIETSGKHKIKRLIFVGDEYQLPPIGLGKPFFDIIEFLTSPENRKHENYIRLMTNCRNGFDEMITKFADIFSDNPYYEDILENAHSSDRLSKGLEILKWSSENDLSILLEKKILDLIGWKQDCLDMDKCYLFNLYHGFDEKEQFKMATFHSKLQLDRMQIISPYRSQHYGTLAINDFIQNTFKEQKTCYKSGCIFLDTEKIICINNLYSGRGASRRLDLSNGSIGFVKNNSDWSRLYFFPDEKDMNIGKTGIYDYLKEEENFELGYSITVHKAQGSDFKNVLVVIPKRQVLLWKELLYTALTRSKETVTIFIEKTDYNLFEKIRNKSKIENVNSSIFQAPDEWKKRLYPEPGVKVKSYQEYNIYKKLKERNIRFIYEEKLKLSSIPVQIKPDFTIYDSEGNVLFYWEHLGILNKEWYSEPWFLRKKAYEKDGYLKILITTDALNGFEDEILDKIIDDIEKMTIKDTSESNFSNHHYQLYYVK